MASSHPHHRTVGLCTTVLLIVMLCPALAIAAPSRRDPSNAEIERKKAEHAATVKELERMQADLRVEVDEYVELGRQSAAARSKVSEVTTQIAELDARLIEKEDALVERAIEIYRTDRIGMVGIILDARSAADLFTRLGYLMTISRRDAQLITEVRLARSESLWLQEGLTQQLRMLSDLQYSASLQRSKIESDIASQQKKAAELGKDVRRLVAQERMRLLAVGGIPQGEFNPDLVVSDAEFTNAFSMSAEDIQAFLDRQPGTLKWYVAPDHQGRLKPAAQIIAEAAQAWGVSPKVIMVTLQKEQSLIQRAHPTERSYDWAMGCGKMESRTIEGYRGFGNQVWYGARALKRNGAGWHEGVEMRIDGSYVLPANRSTYSLYKYTPHFSGGLSFWRLYWRYFGNPLAVLRIIPA